MSSEKVSSPTRRYVAICNKTNFDGYYLKQFTLPKSQMGTLCHECQRWEFGEYPLCPSCGSDQVGPVAGMCENNAERAAWYFLNRLDAVACVEMVITQEAYDDIAATRPIVLTQDAQENPVTTVDVTSGIPERCSNGELEPCNCAMH